MACEDCLEVCFVGLVLGRNYVWCLDIVVIFLRFGQAGAKKVWGMLKSHQLQVAKVKKEGLFSKGRQVLTM